MLLEEEIRTEGNSGLQDKLVNRNRIVVPIIPDKEHARMTQVKRPRNLYVRTVDTSIRRKRSVPHAEKLVNFAANETISQKYAVAAGKYMKFANHMYRQPEQNILCMPQMTILLIY